MSTMKNHLGSLLSRLALCGLAVPLILLSPALVRADAITTFDVSGTARNVSRGTLGSCALGATCAFSGMFQVDTTIGKIESSGFDITFLGLPAFAQFSLSEPIKAQPPFWEIQGSAVVPTPPPVIPPLQTKDYFFLGFNTAPTPGSLVAFTGGSNLAGKVSSQLYDHGFPLGPPVQLYAITGGSIRRSQTMQAAAVLAPVPVPEPSSLVLFASGMLVFGLTRRFGKKVGHPLSA